MKGQIADIQKLSDILDFISEVEAYTSGKTEDDFYKRPEIEKWGLVKLIENIGEAASKLTEGTRNNSNTDWRVIIGMRNRLVHEYDAINYTTVYEVATIEMDALKVEIEKLLYELRLKFKDEL
jgi:uncharacterized protein with HEPN domain